MKIAIVYWSGTGNTEAMAEALLANCKEQGAEASLFQVSAFTASDINLYDAVAFGCPAMGDEVLEEEEFQPLWDSVRPLLSGRKIALFGSYSWNDGEWMRLWEKEALADGAVLVCDCVTAYEAPDDECLAKLKEMAASLIK